MIVSHPSLSSKVLGHRNILFKTMEVYYELYIYINFRSFLILMKIEYLNNNNLKMEVIS